MHFEPLDTQSLIKHHGKNPAMTNTKNGILSYISPLGPPFMPIVNANQYTNN